MGNNRIPKALMYGRIASGTSGRGRQTTYLNSAKGTLPAAGINPANLQELAADRGTWRKTYKEGIIHAEKDRN